MKDLVMFIAQAVVEHPDQVQVKEIPGEDGTQQLELSVAKADMGRIIGKNGRVIQSIRSIAFAMARKEKRRVKITLVD
mgnify:CR=1 FL=1